MKVLGAGNVHVQFDMLWDGESWITFIRLLICINNCRNSMSELFTSTSVKERKEIST